MQARVYVSVGSNIDKERNIRSAMDALRRRYGGIIASSVYESEPVGLEADNFYNLVVAFDTDQLPAAVTASLHDIESRHRRHKGEKRFTSRTLDLDLLLYDDLVLRDGGLQIPREEVTTCAYVLGPLAEIAGEVRHPASGERFADLWARFDRPSQAIWPVKLG